MNRGQKVSLKHAANAIDGTRNGILVTLGATASGVDTGDSTDKKGRKYPSVFLAERAGFTPTSQYDAQRDVVNGFGLTMEQAEKVDKLAASTHNLKQRSQRVAHFIRNVATVPGYVGQSRPSTTGAVARSL